VVENPSDHASNQEAKHDWNHMKPWFSYDWNYHALCSILHSQDSQAILVCELLSQPRFSLATSGTITSILSNGCGTPESNLGLYNHSDTKSACLNAKQTAGIQASSLLVLPAKKHSSHQKDLGLANCWPVSG